MCDGIYPVCVNTCTLGVMTFTMCVVTLTLCAWYHVYVDTEPMCADVADALQPRLNGHSGHGGDVALHHGLQRRPQPAADAAKER